MQEALPQPEINIHDLLFPFQGEDRDKLITLPRGILGSEMGTGKTEVFIAMCDKLQLNRTLIAAPKTMVLEWKDRIEKRLGIPASVPYGTVEGKYHRFSLGKEHFGNHFLIVSHEMMRMERYLEVLKLVPWDAIGYDEAHRFKNRKAKQTYGAQLLATRTERLVHITGTPFENYPDELWSLLNMLDSKEWGPYNAFVKEYCIQVPSPWGPRIVGPNKKNQPELRRRLHEIMIRRERIDVMKDLPGKFPTRHIPVQFSEKQHNAYRRMEQEYVVALKDGENLFAPSMLARLTRLRQISLDPGTIGIDAPSAKADTLLDLLKDFTRDQKVIVFSYYASFLRRFAEKLEPGTFEMIIGGQTAQERRNARLRIQEADVIRVGLVSLMAGGVGIDLTSASVAIFTDIFWTPSVNHQAEDRLDRFGQENKVSIIRLVAPNTIDDDMNKLEEKKEKVFNETVAIHTAVQGIVERNNAKDMEFLMQHAISDAVQIFTLEDDREGE
ncbi:hypothetical protein LCGC14_0429450 [marine sediment metagenome]|uniref:Helicase ATP-binding domain-containing protein n=1 Tax=marine sediment metagenome TaxID=412755 RepID=A0A0F9SUH1_9ZZZZ